MQQSRRVAPANSQRVLQHLFHSALFVVGKVARGAADASVLSNREHTARQTGCHRRHLQAIQRGVELGEQAGGDGGGGAGAVEHVGVARHLPLLHCS